VGEHDLPPAQAPHGGPKEVSLKPIVACRLGELKSGRTVVSEDLSDLVDAFDLGPEMPPDAFVAIATSDHYPPW